MRVVILLDALRERNPLAATAGCGRISMRTRQFCGLTARAGGPHLNHCWVNLHSEQGIARFETDARDDRRSIAAAKTATPDSS
jgi:hypothetical protein